MANQLINSMSQTWNSGGTTFSAIKMNVTDTASHVNSLLQQWQVGGVDMFSVGKDGKGYFAGDVEIGGGDVIGLVNSRGATILVRPTGLIRLH